MVYDEEKYTIWRLPNPVLLHWILNPAIAINEVVLGQRIPKVTLIDKTSKTPLMERQCVPCPSCGVIHDGRLWSGSNSFGHWFGYVCPNCEKKIPCLWNITSLILLIFLLPIWAPLKYFFEKKYITYELSRYQKVNVAKVVAKNKFLWIVMGLVFGALMFLLLLSQKYIQGNVDSKGIEVLAVSALVGGILFGFIMWVFVGRAKK